MVIRTEQPADIAQIHDLTRRAFAPMSFSDGTEQFVVDALRAQAVLTISLVAERDGMVVGHVAFSPVGISDGSTGWYGLGPISVEPALQGRGIGRLLIEHGLAALRKLGAAGCVVLGNPKLYQRFGFVPMPQLRYVGADAVYFMAQPFGLTSACGEVKFHVAFEATG